MPCYFFSFCFSCHQMTFASFFILFPALILSLLVSSFASCGGCLPLASQPHSTLGERRRGEKRRVKERREEKRREPVASHVCMSDTIARLHSHLSVHKAQVFSGTKVHTHTSYTARGAMKKSKKSKKNRRHRQRKAKESKGKQRKAKGRKGKKKNSESAIERCVYASRSDFFLILTTQASSFLFSTVYYALHSAHKSVST